MSAQGTTPSPPMQKDRAVTIFERSKPGRRIRRVFEQGGAAEPALQTRVLVLVRVRFEPPPQPRQPRDLRPR